MSVELWTDLRAISVFELMQNEMDAGVVDIAVGYRGQYLQAAMYSGSPPCIFHGEACSYGISF
jgi:hypothetical protein